MYTTGSIGVNDQLLSTPMASWFLPGNSVGPILKGTGNTYPATIPAGISGSGAYSVADGSGSENATRAGSNPWSFVHSPVIMLVAALLVAVLGLHFIHYK